MTALPPAWWKTWPPAEKMLSVPQDERMAAGLKRLKDASLPRGPRQLKIWDILVSGEAFNLNESIAWCEANLGPMVDEGVDQMTYAELQDHIPGLGPAPAWPPEALVARFAVLDDPGLTFLRDVAEESNEGDEPGAYAAGWMAFHANQELVRRNVEAERARKRRERVNQRAAVPVDVEDKPTREEWERFWELRARDVVEACGLHQGRFGRDKRKGWGPCPGCEGRLSLFGDAAWKCHRCDVGGRGGHLIAWAQTSTMPSKGDPAWHWCAQWAKARGLL